MSKIAQKVDAEARSTKGAPLSPEEEMSALLSQSGVQYFINCIDSLKENDYFIEYGLGRTIEGLLRSGNSRTIETAEQAKRIVDYIDRRLLGGKYISVDSSSDQIAELVLIGLQGRWHIFHQIEAIQELYNRFEGVSEPLTTKTTLELVAELFKDPNKFIKFLASEVGKPEAQPRLLPTSAPATWKADKQVGETPPDFIRRVYGVWLGKGLDRAHIRNLDRPLYQALDNWLRHHEMPADFDLPTRKEQNTRWVERVEREGLAAVIPGGSSESVLREARRLTAAKERRRTT